MIARIIGILLGLALAALGYAVLEPQGYVGAYLPPLDLGPFEASRAMVGLTGVGIGMILLIAAALQRSGKAKEAPAFAFAEEAPAEERYEEAPMSMGGDSPQPRPLW